MGKIKIKVIFSGSFTEKRQEKELDLNIQNDLTALVKEIDRVIIQRKGARIPYVLLKNGIDFSMIKNSQGSLKDGDVLTVVPIVSGG